MRVYGNPRVSMSEARGNTLTVPCIRGCLQNPDTVAKTNVPLKAFFREVLLIFLCLLRGSILALSGHEVFKDFHLSGFRRGNPPKKPLETRFQVLYWI